VERRKLRLRYEAESGAATERIVRPLGVFFWGKTWTLAAWCELRNDFRNFRLDRMREPAILDRFAEESGKTLRDMLTRYGPEAVKLLDAP
jgi:predicted DNA-binding transcriptional regulator YafY